jgi:hypothetical protein
MTARATARATNWVKGFACHLPSHRNSHLRRFYQLADQLLRSQTTSEAAQVRESLQAAYSEVEA